MPFRRDPSTWLPTLILGLHGSRVGGIGNIPGAMLGGFPLGDQSVGPTPFSSGSFGDATMT
jgi:branched-subunit amino acid ABC-type transport system permease component